MHVLGRLPGQRKSAHTTPVPKGGDSELIESYRAVSVLPVVAKVFERMIHRHAAVCILQPNEFGFRPGHCTQDVLVNMVHRPKSRISNQTEEEDGKLTPYACRTSKG